MNMSGALVHLLTLMGVNQEELDRKLAEKPKIGIADFWRERQKFLDSFWTLLLFLIPGLNIIFFILFLKEFLKAKRKANSNSQESHPLLVYLKEAPSHIQAMPIEQVAQNIIDDNDPAYKEYQAGKIIGRIGAYVFIVCSFLFMTVSLCFFYADDISLPKPTASKTATVTAAPTAVPSYALIDDRMVVYGAACSVEDGRLIIPSTVDGQKVEGIGKLAFEKRTDITSVEIPEGITFIESGAFRSCSALTEVHLPSTLTSLGAEVFRGCSQLKICDIPQGILELRASTFADCSALESVTLPKGIFKINAFAFQNCRLLSSVALPDTLMEIAAYAFYGCTSLQSIAIPESVETLGAYLFSGCTSLEKVTLPTSMQNGKISESAFEKCEKLKAIRIPDGVIKISAHAFEKCASLEQVELPDSLRTIGSSAFRNCKKLTSIAIPSGCSVDERSFKDSPTKVIRK